MTKEPTKSEWIEVRDSKIHGKGVYAAKDIPKDTRVIEYVGDFVTKIEADLISDKELEKSKSNPDSHGAVYLFTLNKEFDINGNVSWNTARLINHSCNPNCETDIVNNHIWIISLKDIKKGEELSYDYAYNLDNYEDHKCNCGSKNCVGYILNSDDRIRLRKKLRWKRKKARRDRNSKES